MKTYHLGTVDRSGSLCGMTGRPDIMVDRPDQIPTGGRICLLCVRRLHGLPICRPVPPHLILPRTIRG